MKKLLSLALACTLTLGLASCGGTGTSTSSNAPASSSAVESPAAQFDAASYLSGDYPKLPEDGPALFTVHRPCDAGIHREPQNASGPERRSGKV